MWRAGHRDRSGRTDASRAGARRIDLPGGYEGAFLLRAMFARMGLGARDLVALSGAHTLGHTQRPPLHARAVVVLEFPTLQNWWPNRMRSSRAITPLLLDPELRHFVEEYAAEEARFFADFEAAFRRLTWLGKLHLIMEPTRSRVRAFARLSGHAASARSTTPCHPRAKRRIHS